MVYSSIIEIIDKIMIWNENMQVIEMIRPCNYYSWYRAADVRELWVTRWNKTLNILSLKTVQY